MPKILHQTFRGGGIAVWHIEESSDVLYGLLCTHRYDEQLKNITHEGRRAEWLAVRVLLSEVLSPDKTIAYQPSGRPFLTDHSYHISISHTKGYAALAYHPASSVGIDVEYISSRVERVAHRFTNVAEQRYIDTHAEAERQMYHLVNWSVKETLYKSFDAPEAADFQSVFTIQPYQLASQGEVVVSVGLGHASNVGVGYAVHEQFVCTWFFSLPD